MKLLILLILICSNYSCAQFSINFGIRQRVEYQPTFQRIGNFPWEATNDEVIAEKKSIPSFFIGANYSSKWVYVNADFVYLEQRNNRFENFYGYYSGGFTHKFKHFISKYDNAYFASRLSAGLNLKKSPFYLGIGFSIQADYLIHLSLTKDSNPGYPSKRDWPFTSLGIEVIPQYDFKKIPVSLSLKSVIGQTIGTREHILEVGYSPYKKDYSNLFYEISFSVGYRFYRKK